MGALDNIRRFLTAGDYNDAAREAAHSAEKFSPGVPIRPADGFSRVPRAHDFLTGYNIAARPRRNERVSFTTLQGIIEAYDVAQMAITHRIDSVRSLDWFLDPIPGLTVDTDEMVQRVTSILAKPDHELPFRAWLSKFLWDVLAYDAGTLYRMRNNAGRAIGLRVVDGTTIAPLIDYHGNRPTGEAPAFVQYAQGVPWNWLTNDDIVYVPFRPMPNTPYGKSPMESILLNANTDLRFQNYFLSRFTEGTVPEGFAASPESWTPNQIEEFQESWDALMMGDETKKHQIRWVPGGTSFTWTREEKFDPEFSLFMMRKTAAAYHVTPNDLGFTDTVNLANGETQTDVQFRIGDLPLIQHVQDILSSFIQDDLGYPLNFRFDTGGEKEDRLATAQVHKLYIDAGVISPSKVAEEIYGIQEPDGQAMPRFIMTGSGPIPLSALQWAAGPVDPETGAPLAPAKGDVLTSSFGKEPGVAPIAGDVEPAVAKAIEPMVKDGEVATVGITAETGLVGSPMVADGEDDDAEEIAKARADEMRVFSRFVKARRKTGTWRDFEFTSLSKEEADALNAQGAADVAPVPMLGWICVHAMDTDRVVMEQRLWDITDKNAGKFDFPGGHVEDGETFKDAALREWQEEIGLPIPKGVWGGTWQTKAGRRQGFVYHIAEEAELNLREARLTGDPDANGTGEADSILWMRLQDLSGNPMVRNDVANNAALIREAVDAAPLAKGWRELASDSTESHLVEVAKETYQPTAGMKTAAKRALRWKDEGKANGAGTPVGWGRATDIVAGRAMSEDVVKRMYSFFARHEVDKQGKGFDDLSDPSNGRIMWDAWGGDAGFTWSKTIIERLKSAELKKDAPVSILAKGWRESANKTPQHEYDIALTDHFAPLVTDALQHLSDALPIRVTVAMFANKQTVDKKTLAAQIVGVLGHGDTSKLNDVLMAITAEGYFAGRHAAEVQIGQHQVAKSMTVTTDWDNWKPGDIAAAGRAADGGLAQLLESAGISITDIADASKQMETSLVNAIGDKIAAGLTQGLSSDAIARSLADLVGARWKAEAIAHTETTRAVQAGTLDVYSVNNIGSYELILSDGACPDCQDVAAGGPYPSSDTNDAPPIHPFCRCATIPVVSDMTGGVTSSGLTAGTALGLAGAGLAAGLISGAVTKPDTTNPTDTPTDEQNYLAE